MKNHKFPIARAQLEPSARRKTLRHLEQLIPPQTSALARVSQLLHRKQRPQQERRHSIEPNLAASILVLAPLPAGQTLTTPRDDDGQIPR